MQGRVNVGIPAELHAALQERAAQERTSIAHLIEVACIAQHSLSVTPTTRHVYIKDHELSQQVAAIKREARAIAQRARREAEQRERWQLEDDMYEKLGLPRLHTQPRGTTLLETEGDRDK